MRIGIMGGTFNPPHRGHKNAANAAKDALGLSKIIFVPTAIPPHKELSDDSASEKDRLEMTRLLAGEIGGEASDIEIASGGRNYTADTLSKFREMYPDDELWFIMGTDMFLSLQNWRTPEKIFSLASIAVVPRSDDDAEKLEDHAKWLCEKFGARASVINAAAVDISSTELRDMKTREELLEFIPEKILDYIEKRRLYGI